VTYEYSVGGRKMRNSRISTVEVRVNPDNPAEATLDARGDGRIAYVLWGIAAIFAALALFVATRVG
jgi:hypothetical protein